MALVEATHDHWADLVQEAVDGSAQNFVETVELAPIDKESVEQLLLRPDEAVSTILGDNPLSLMDKFVTNPQGVWPVTQDLVKKIYGQFVQFEKSPGKLAETKEMIDDLPRDARMRVWAVETANDLGLAGKQRARLIDEGEWLARQAGGRMPLTLTDRAVTDLVKQYYESTVQVRRGAGDHLVISNKAMDDLVRATLNLSVAPSAALSWQQMVATSSEPGLWHPTPDLWARLQANYEAATAQALRTLVTSTFDHEVDGASIVNMVDPRSMADVNRIVRSFGITNVGDAVRAMQTFITVLRTVAYAGGFPWIEVEDGRWRRMLQDLIVAVVGGTLQYIVTNGATVRDAFDASFSVPVIMGMFRNLRAPTAGDFQNFAQHVRIKGPGKWARDSIAQPPSNIGTMQYDAKSALAKLLSYRGILPVDKPLPVTQPPSSTERRRFGTRGNIHVRYNVPQEATAPYTVWWVLETSNGTRLVSTDRTSNRELHLNYTSRGQEGFVPESDEGVLRARMTDGDNVSYASEGTMVQVYATPEDHLGPFSMRHILPTVMAQRNKKFTARLRIMAARLEETLRRVPAVRRDMEILRLVDPETNVKYQNELVLLARREREGSYQYGTPDPIDQDRVIVDAYMYATDFDQTVDRVLHTLEVNGIDVDGEIHFLQPLAEPKVPTEYPLSTLPAGAAPPAGPAAPGKGNWVSEHVDIISTAVVGAIKRFVDTLAPIRVPHRPAPPFPGVLARPAVPVPRAAPVAPVRRAPARRGPARRVPRPARRRTVTHPPGFGIPRTSPSPSPVTPLRLPSPPSRVSRAGEIARLAENIAEDAERLGDLTASVEKLQENLRKEQQDVVRELSEVVAADKVLEDRRAELKKKSREATAAAEAGTPKDPGIVQRAGNAVKRARKKVKALENQKDDSTRRVREITAELEARRGEVRAVSVQRDADLALQEAMRLATETEEEEEEEEEAEDVETVEEGKRVARQLVSQIRADRIRKENLVSKLHSIQLTAQTAFNTFKANGGTETSTMTGILETINDVVTGSFGLVKVREGLDRLERAIATADTVDAINATISGIREIANADGDTKELAYFLQLATEATDDVMDRIGAEQARMSEAAFVKDELERMEHRVQRIQEALDGIMATRTGAVEARAALMRIGFDDDDLTTFDAAFEAMKGEGDLLVNMYVNEIQNTFLELQRSVDVVEFFNQHLTKMDEDLARADDMVESAREAQQRLTIARAALITQEVPQRLAEPQAEDLLTKYHLQLQDRKNQYDQVVGMLKALSRTAIAATKLVAKLPDGSEKQTKAASMLAAIKRSEKDIKDELESGKKSIRRAISSIQRRLNKNGLNRVDADLALVATRLADLVVIAEQGNLTVKKINDIAKSEGAELVLSDEVVELKAMAAIFKRKNPARSPKLTRKDKTKMLNAIHDAIGVEPQNVVAGILLNAVENKTTDTISKTTGLKNNQPKGKVRTIFVMILSDESPPMTRLLRTLMKNEDFAAVVRKEGDLEAQLNARVVGQAPGPTPPPADLDVPVIPEIGSGKAPVETPHPQEDLGNILARYEALQRESEFRPSPGPRTENFERFGQDFKAYNTRLNDLFDLAKTRYEKVDDEFFAPRVIEFLLREDIPSTNMREVSDAWTQFVNLDESTRKAASRIEIKKFAATTNEDLDDLKDEVVLYDGNVRAMDDLKSQLKVMQRNATAAADAGTPEGRKRHGPTMEPFKNAILTYMTPGASVDDMVVAIGKMQNTGYAAVTVGNQLMPLVTQEPGAFKALAEAMLAHRNEGQRKILQYLVQDFAVEAAMGEDLAERVGSPEPVVQMSPFIEVQEDAPDFVRQIIDGVRQDKIKADLLATGTSVQSAKAVLTTVNDEWGVIKADANDVHYDQFSVLHKQLEALIGQIQAKTDESADALATVRETFAQIRSLNAEGEWDYLRAEAILIPDQIKVLTDHRADITDLMKHVRALRIKLFVFFKTVRRGQVVSVVDKPLTVVDVNIVKSNIQNERSKLERTIANTKRRMGVDDLAIIDIRVNLKDRRVEAANLNEEDRRGLFRVNNQVAGHLSEISVAMNSIKLIVESNWGVELASLTGMAHKMRKAGADARNIEKNFAASKLLIDEAKQRVSEAVDKIDKLIDASRLVVGARSIDRASSLVHESPDIAESKVKDMQENVRRAKANYRKMLDYCISMKASNPKRLPTVEKWLRGAGAVYLEAVDSLQRVLRAQNTIVANTQAYDSTDERDDLISIGKETAGAMSEINKELNHINTRVNAVKLALRQSIGTSVNRQVGVANASVVASIKTLKEQAQTIVKLVGQEEGANRATQAHAEILTDYVNGIEPEEVLILTNQTDVIHTALSHWDRENNNQVVLLQDQIKNAFSIMVEKRNSFTENVGNGKLLVRTLKKEMQQKKAAPAVVEPATLPELGETPPSLRTPSATPTPADPADQPGKMAAEGEGEAIKALETIAETVRDSSSGTESRVINNFVKQLEKAPRTVDDSALVDVIYTSLLRKGGVGGIRTSTTNKGRLYKVFNTILNTENDDIGKLIRDVVTQHSDVAKVLYTKNIRMGVIRARLDKRFPEVSVANIQGEVDAVAKTFTAETQRAKDVDAVVAAAQREEVAAHRARSENPESTVKEQVDALTHAAVAEALAQRAEVDRGVNSALRKDMAALREQLKALTGIDAKHRAQTDAEASNLADIDEKKTALDASAADLTNEQLDLKRRLHNSMAGLKDFEAQVEIARKAEKLDDDEAEQARKGDLKSMQRELLGMKRDLANDRILFKQQKESIDESKQDVEESRLEILQREARAKDKQRNAELKRALERKDEERLRAEIAEKDIEHREFLAKMAADQKREAAEEAKRVAKQKKEDELAARRKKQLERKEQLEREREQREAQDEAARKRADQLDADRLRRQAQLDDDEARRIQLAREDEARRVRLAREEARRQQQQQAIAVDKQPVERETVEEELARLERELSESAPAPASITPAPVAPRRAAPRRAAPRRSARTAKRKRGPTEGRRVRKETPMPEGLPPSRVRPGQSAPPRARPAVQVPKRAATTPLSGQPVERKGEKRTAFFRRLNKWKRDKKKPGAPQKEKASVFAPPPAQKSPPPAQESPSPAQESPAFQESPPPVAQVDVDRERREAEAAERAAIQRVAEEQRAAQKAENARLEQEEAARKSAAAKERAAHERQEVVVATQRGDIEAKLFVLGKLTQTMPGSNANYKNTFMVKLVTAMKDALQVGATERQVAQHLAQGFYGPKRTFVETRANRIFNYLETNAPNLMTTFDELPNVNHTDQDGGRILVQQVERFNAWNKEGEEEEKQEEKQEDEGRRVPEERPVPEGKRQRPSGKAAQEETPPPGDAPLGNPEVRKIAAQNLLQSTLDEFAGVKTNMRSLDKGKPRKLSKKAEENRTKYVDLIRLQVDGALKAGVPLRVVANMLLVSVFTKPDNRGKVNARKNGQGDVVFIALKDEYRNVLEVMRTPDPRFKDDQRPKKFAIAYKKAFAALSAGAPLVWSEIGFEDAEPLEPLEPLDAKEEEKPKTQRNRKPSLVDALAQIRVSSEISQVVTRHKSTIRMNRDNAARDALIGYAQQSPAIKRELKTALSREGLRTQAGWL